MKNDIAIKMSPEGLEIANAYLELGSIPAVCVRLKIDEKQVQEYLGKREIIINIAERFVLFINLVEPIALKGCLNK